MSARTRGLLWALVYSPIISWVTAVSAQIATHRIGPTGVLILLVVLPAVLAGRQNLKLGRSPLVAGMLALGVCFGGFYFAFLYAVGQTS